jgi:signal transduction histidine kinase
MSAPRVDRDSGDMSSKKRIVLQFILLRFLFITAILMAAIIVQFSTSTFLPLNNFYILIGASYFLSLVYFVIYQSGRGYDQQAYIQICFDLIWITAVVYISGGLEGSFYFIYVFEIIAAGIVLSSKASYLTAALSCIFFGGLVSLMYYNLIPVYGRGSGAISYGQVMINIFISWSVFFLVAFLISYLTGSLKKAKKALELVEKELEVKKNLALMGDVSAHLAHEIRNPLAAISGSAQVLRKEMPLSDEQGKLMDIIIDESKRVSFSLEQFLNLATPAPRTFYEIDLSALLDETIVLLKASGELNGAYHLGGNYLDAKIKYMGNRSQFKQVFWNILRNSIQAMPDGGDLNINFSERAGEGIRLSFADTGAGISLDTKEKIFEPFFSGSKDGRGLGLSVVRRIIDDYNGNIRVSSQPGRGTEIVITLPSHQVR